jgi:hypothetical protein
MSRQNNSYFLFLANSSATINSCYSDDGYDLDEIFLLVQQIKQTFGYDMESL